MAKKEQEIDKQLKELAVTDWEKFKELTGLDVTLYTICTMKKKGKTIRQISNSLKIPKSTIHDKCKICP